MIQFILVFALILFALWKWDYVEVFAMNIGEYIETIREDIADGLSPLGKVAKLIGAAAIISTVITLIL